MGKWLIVIGILCVAAGVILVYAPGLVSWFGKLPGDIRFENEKTRIFIPITSMLLLSVLITIIVSVVKYLIRK